MRSSVPLPARDGGFRVLPIETEGLVARHRLLDLLDRAPAQSLLWVAAGPGAGKSALAATWAERRMARQAGLELLWYPMDELDADPLRFCATLGRFLGLAHGFGPDLPAHPDPAAFAGLSEAARRWLATGPPGPRPGGARLLVFDDVHHVPPDALAVALLPALAAALRPEDRVLCLSRRVPPDAVAPAASMVLLTELQVDAGEYADFARDLPGGAALSPELFLTALRRSGGWIREISSIAGQLIAPQETARAAALYAAERQVLLSTAFLPDGTDREWQALGGPTAPAVLHRLVEAGGLASLLPQGGLRKHDAFQALLVRDAEAQLAPAALDAARRGAAGLLAVRRQVLPAARLLIAAGDGAAALRLFLEQAASMSLSGRTREIEETVALFPPEIAAQVMPQIWLAYARIPYEPREAQRCLHEIRLSLQPAAAPLEFALALTGETRSMLSDLFDFQGLVPLVEEIDRALPDLASLPPAVMQGLVLTRCMAVLIGWPTHPEVNRTRQEIEAALPFLPRNAQLLLGSVLANYLIWWRGELAAARPFLDYLAQTARDPDMAPLAVMTWYYAALSCAFFDGDDDRLRQLTDETVAFAGHRGVSHRLTNAFWVVTQAYAGAGDERAATAMLERYAASAQRHWRRSEFIGAHHLRALVALSVGDTGTAIAEAEQALDYARRFGGPHQIANQSQLLAAALAMTGSSAALAHIETLRAVAAHTGNATFLLQADLAEASLALAGGGDVATPWSRAAEAGSRHGFRRIAGMNRARLSALANRGLEQGADPAATRRAVALWQLPPPLGIAHEAWPFAVQIRALGGFTVEVDGVRIAMGTGKAQRKPMELLWSLLAGPPEGLAQEVLADELWPEADGDRAIHSLRTTIYRLRKLLGADSIRHEDEHVGLPAGQVRADVLDLAALITITRDRTEFLGAAALGARPGDRPVSRAAAAGGAAARRGCRLPAHRRRSGHGGCRAAADPGPGRPPDRAARQPAARRRPGYRPAARARQPARRVSGTILSRPSHYFASIMDRVSRSPVSLWSRRCNHGRVRC